MTRKDYVALAEAIAAGATSANVWAANASDPGRERERMQRAVAYTGKLIVREIALVLAADNPRFDRQRFEIACGEYLEPAKIEANRAKRVRASGQIGEV